MNALRHVVVILSMQQGFNSRDQAVLLDRPTWVITRCRPRTNAGIFEYCLEREYISYVCLQP